MTQNELSEGIWKSMSRVSRLAAHLPRLISTRRQRPKRSSAGPAEDIAGSHCHCSPALCLPLAENQRLCSGATCPNFAGVLAALAAVLGPQGLHLRARGGLSFVGGRIHPVFGALTKVRLSRAATPEAPDKTTHHDFRRLSFPPLQDHEGRAWILTRLGYDGLVTCIFSSFVLCGDGNTCFFLKTGVR